MGIEETSTERVGRAPQLPTGNNLRVASLVNLPAELLGNIYDQIHEPKEWFALRCSNSILASSMPPKIRDILLTSICNYSLSVYFFYDRLFQFNAATFAPLWQTKRALVVESQWPDRDSTPENTRLKLPDLPELRHLKTLELIGNKNVSSSFSAYDPRLSYLFDKTPRLQSLKIKNYANLYKQIPSILRKITELKHLDIHHSAVSLFWFCYDLNTILEKARELQSLSIQKTEERGTLSVSHIIEDNHTLKSLTCSFLLAQRVNVDELHALGHLVKLQTLTINNDLGAHIVCLQHLRNNEELRSLTLPVSRSSFNAGVPSLPQLTCLNLQDNPIIPEGGERVERTLIVSSPNWLGGFTNLTELRIPDLFKANEDVFSCVTRLGFKWDDERAAFIR